MVWSTVLGWLGVCSSMLECFFFCVFLWSGVFFSFSVWVGRVFEISLEVKSQQSENQLMTHSGTRHDPIRAFCSGLHIHQHGLNNT